MAWTCVPCGTRMSGPGFCNDRPRSPMAYTVRASPSSLSGCHCPSPSSRDIVRTPSRSSPAGERLSLAAIVGRRSAAHRRLEAATRTVRRHDGRAKFETVEHLSLGEFEDRERRRRTPRSVAQATSRNSRTMPKLFRRFAAHFRCRRSLGPILGNGRSGRSCRVGDCSRMTCKPAVILRGKPLKLIWEAGANLGSGARI